MSDRNVARQGPEEQYGAEYDYFQARLAKRGITSYEWWASRFIARLIHRYQSGGRLLEIGCGLGRTLQLLEGDFETYGIDVSEYAVELAQETATRSDIRHMDARDLSAFDDDSFDVVLAAHVFEHLDEPAATLGQCVKLLRAGGLLLYLVPNTDCISRTCKGEEWFGFRDPGHVSLLSPSEWLALTRSSGLRVLKVFGDGLWDAPYMPVVPTAIQQLVLFVPSLVQFQLGVPFWPAKLGEDLGVVARK